MNTQEENTQTAEIQLPAGYPRPQFERESFINLNGLWQFAKDIEGQLKRPSSVDFDQHILVPFAPETSASLIADKSFYQAVWYRRIFDTPKMKEGDRLLLHFGAVDWNARVFVNGELAVTHEGGYTPFFADITDLLVDGKTQRIVVQAQDNPHDLEKNRGKQDWEENEHSIWYPRTTGIWQTVWMEVVPAFSLAKLDWTTNDSNWTITAQGFLSGTVSPGSRVRIKLTAPDGGLIADDTYTLSTDELNRASFKRTLKVVDVEERLQLPDDYINRLRDRLLWHPDRPNLIAATVQLTDSENVVIDQVKSYTAFRTVETQGRNLKVNGHNEILRLVLDQGYWLETGMTPPSDEALKLDIELMKQAGFNGCRKHNKLEDPRFLYWADVLGFYVWEELPSAYLFTAKGMERSTETWFAAIERDRNHPSIIAWVPINESWGTPNLPDSQLQREYQRSMYRLTKAFTGGALVIGNDGWEMVESDIVAVHDYDADVEKIRRRYEDTKENLDYLFANERPGGRVLLLEDMDYRDKPIMLTEFGGIKYSREAGTWGYSTATSAEDLNARYKALMQVVCSLPVVGGFCYTEFTDVYQEANGLFWMDRSPKFPIEDMRRANRNVQD